MSLFFLIFWPGGISVRAQNAQLQAQAAAEAAQNAFMQAQAAAAAPSGSSDDNSGGGEGRVFLHLGWSQWQDMLCNFWRREGNCLLFEQRRWCGMIPEKAQTLAQATADLIRGGSEVSKTALWGQLFAMDSGHLPATIDTSVEFQTACRAVSFRILCEGKETLLDFLIDAISSRHASAVTNAGLFLANTPGLVGLVDTADRGDNRPLGWRVMAEILTNYRFHADLNATLAKLLPKLRPPCHNIDELMDRGAPYGPY
uniref:Uncharacterized protein n=1 Tax=Globodera rostochiensis TaxID=31243 RepID=A0A914GR93_GLORO